MRLLSAITLLSILAASVAVAAPSKTVESSKSDLSRLGQGTAAIDLLSEDDKPVSLDDLNGKPRVLFFGFTPCPGVCPVTVCESDAALA